MSRSQASRSLERVVSQLPADLDIIRSLSINRPLSQQGLIGSRCRSTTRDLVVVGSSSSGLLGRVALGSVTDRLVHTCGSARGDRSARLPAECRIRYAG